jgi:siroheme synthase-like protein
MAEEKARGLLNAGARVTVLSLEVTTGLAELAGEGRLAHRPRPFQRGDLLELQDVAVVIVVNQDRETVAAVWEETRGRNVLVNTLDDVPHCDFIAPAIVRRGDLAVAISTGGKAPVLAVRLRQRLENELGEEHARFLDLAGAVRAPLARRWPDFATRRDLWYRLVDSDVLDLLRAGDEPAALNRFEEILGVRPVGAG